MKIRDAILVEQLPLPPIPAELAYQYVVAGNGLFIRAEDSRIEALVPVALGAVSGLESVESYARLKVPRVPARFLAAVEASATRRLPNEAMYQFTWQGVALGWKCAMPMQETEIASAKFADDGNAVIDLHSHGNLSAFFSETDDDDEQGLRFYVVIGDVGGNTPQIACRVGVYGHHWNVPVTTIFDSVGYFIEVDPEIEQAREKLLEELENEKESAH